jgi:hypothetical protein
MTWQFWSVLPVWVLTVSAAIFIGIASPPEAQFTRLPLAFAAAVAVTFAIQLAIQRKDGLVLRAMASIGGAMLILAAATGVLALIG